MEHETFFSLLTDAAHWEFEGFLTMIFDVIIMGGLWGLLIYPALRKWWKHHKSDDDKIKALEDQNAELVVRIEALENRLN